MVGRVSAARDFVKVLDFGLVKLEGAQQSERSLKLTDDTSVSGTPGFIAPEVVLGNHTDHRVDIYSLGCVAFWLPTGKLVFEGPGAVKVMSDHVHTPPVRPSSRSELPVPPELDALILECLEKDPAKRPATASELWARLQEIPVATPWTPERAESWWNDHAPDNRAARRGPAPVAGSAQGPRHSASATLTRQSGGPNQVVSASRRPGSVPSPTHATYPSGRIKTALGAETVPSTGSSQAPA